MAVTSGTVRGTHTTRRRWAVVVAAAFAVSALAAPPALADDPDPETSTVLRVSVGGDRTGAAQADVAGLDGVVLGAYADGNPTPIATCTSVAGICSLVIPDTDAGGANYEQQFWIRQISAPTGWYTNPQLRTGGSGASPANQRNYEFRTPELTEREYLSDELMPSTGMSAGTETAALGHWQQSRNNPALPAKCGIGRVLILTDWSSSVGQNPGYPKLVETLDQVADAFAGTRASLAFLPFGYQQIAASTAYYPMSSPTEVAAFKNVYGSMGNQGTQGTNWDAGLRAATTVDPDLVIMLTDGNPTVWGAGAQGQSSASSNQIADIEAAIFAANALKKSSARIVALGVGDGVSDASHGALNLSAVSGPTKFNGSNYLQADYFQTTNYDDAAEAFREMAMASCAGTLTVVKQIVPPNGTIADAVVAGPGWQFTVDGEGITGGTANTKADQTGTVGFDLGVTSEFETDLTISERQFAGYTLLPVDGQPDGPRAVCSAVGSNTTRTVTNDPDDPHGVILPDVPVHEATTCTFYNQAPEESTAVQVDKRWVINGEEVANGDQPAGLEASLALVALPRDAGGDQYPVEDAQFGESYLQYPAPEPTDFMAADDVTVGETVTDGPYCTSDPQRTTIHALAQESDPNYDGVHQPLRVDHKVNLSADPEWNHLIITNYAECTPAPQWTLSKTSDPASGSTVDRGDRVTYTVTATNLEPDSIFSLENLTVVDDLSGVLDQADLDVASIVASTGSAAFAGTELTWTIDTLVGTATLTYDVVVRDDADDGATIANSVYGEPSGGDPEIPFTQGIPPEQCVVDDPCGTIHYTPRIVVPSTVYDLALRMWVGEVYRDQQLVHELFPLLTDVGPDYDEPYVGFDDGYTTLPGDLMVHDIELFNQGTGTVRVEQLVGYLPSEGLALADPADVAAIVPVDGPITNQDWSLGSDGHLYYDPEDPIVLLPGETARVPLTLVVGTIAAPDLSQPSTPVTMYAEISQFSGQVDEENAAELGLGAGWHMVEDADSHPDTIDNEPVDNHYKNHVIDEHAFADISGVRTFLAAVDEDDHDGTHLQVVRLEVLPDPDPAGGSQAGSSGVGDPLALTGGVPWLVGGIALVVMMVGGATLAWSRRMRSAGR